MKGLFSWHFLSVSFHRSIHKVRSVAEERTTMKAFNGNKIGKPKTIFLDVKPTLNAHNPRKYSNGGINFENSITLYGTGRPSLTSAKSIQQYQVDVMQSSIRPAYMFLRAIGVFPITRNIPGEAHFKVISPAFGYAFAFFTFLAVYVTFVTINRIKIVSNLEGRFEEAVIAYLFLVNILPVFIIPITWAEARKVASVMNDWNDFEVLYYQISGYQLQLDLKIKALVLTILLPIFSILSVVITHVTMADFKIVQVIPYCILDNLTVMLGAWWYIWCESLSKAAFILAENFQKALRHIGPAAMVADYRALWLRLSKLTRDTGGAACYSFTYLNLYLFFIITLSIYGLMSQISEGFGIKDIGLAVTALSSVCLLFFICDEAHFASQQVRTNFQKKLLMVELSWMNSDAQSEINMFLRATEMNPSNINCGGFFDVNRNLFKSLLTTMVTYLVVLLQFQISIPEDNSGLRNSTEPVTTTATPT